MTKLDNIKYCDNDIVQDIREGRGAGREGKGRKRGG